MFVFVCLADVTKQTNSNLRVSRYNGWSLVQKLKRDILVASKAVQYAIDIMQALCSAKCLPACDSFHWCTALTGSNNVTKQNAIAILRSK